MKLKKKAAPSARSAGTASGGHQAAGAGGGRGSCGKTTAREDSGDKKTGGQESKTSPLYDSDDENEGFGNWLRSSDGVAYMRLFVLANSLLVVVTMGWPHVVEVFGILREVMGV